MKQHTTPCAQCAFRRTIKPGELGGSSPFTYVGQANGSFWIPCHCHTNYDDPNWKTDLAKPECAGTAVFRANCGVPPRAGVLQLPKDTENVFASYAEFVAHHTGCTLQEAEEVFAQFHPDVFTFKELKRAGVKLHLIPK